MFDKTPTNPCEVKKSFMSIDNEKVSIWVESMTTIGVPSWFAFTVLTNGRILTPRPTAGNPFPYFPISWS